MYPTKKMVSVALALAFLPSVLGPKNNHELQRSYPAPVEPSWYADVADIREQLEEWPSAYPLHVDEVALAVAEFSDEAGLNPTLVLAVMRVENPWLKPDTVSHAGAVGLLQVMPKYWDDSFHECGSDLRDIRTNVCKGTKILAHYLDSHSTMDDALLAYNGCRSHHCRNYVTYVRSSLD